MPNWCRGTLKIRGKKEDLIRFIEEGTSILHYENLTYNEIKPICHNDVEYDLKILNAKESDTLYIKGTRRNFAEIEDGAIYCVCTDEKKSIYIILFEDYRAAWNISAMDLKEISKKFNIDIKIYGFEQGMEFNRDVEILNGKIIKDEEKTFENYTWDCISPLIGG